MAKIGPWFRLSYDNDDGCPECGDGMYEGDETAYVDDELTCENCVREHIDRQTITSVGRKIEQRRSTS